VFISTFRQKTWQVRIAVIKELRLARHPSRRTISRSMYQADSQVFEGVYLEIAAPDVFQGSAKVETHMPLDLNALDPAG
jgi:hypothetical protein